MATLYFRVGAPMSAVPYRSRLWSAADADGSRLVTWESFALNRDTNTPVNAQIELRPSGDFVTRSNEVETVCRRVDDFDWDGDGIPNWDDGSPYRHDGDHTGQADGWAEYVDETVGTGLENGYYKLTATFPQAGFRRTLLTVGWHEVVVAEPGEYAFLLEKGTDYEFDIEPFSPDVSFDVADDIPLGTYTDWEYATGSHHGTDAVYNPSSGGIYQVQALAGLGWGAGDERYYVWEDYSDYIHGIKVPGDVKAFGVCDEEWQKQLRDAAMGYIGSNAYAFDARVPSAFGYSAVPGRSWKCNIFVAHRLSDCGMHIPAVQHGRFGLKDWPPLANQWGNASFDIAGWSMFFANGFIQPGMIAVAPLDGPNWHVGIIDFDGMAISAQRDSVTRRSNIPARGNAVYRTHCEEDAE